MYGCLFHSQILDVASLNDQINHHNTVQVLWYDIPELVYFMALDVLSKYGKCGVSTAARSHNDVRMS